MQIAKSRTVDNVYQIRPSARSVSQIIGSTSTITNALMQLAKSRTVESVYQIRPSVRNVN